VADELTCDGCGAAVPKGDRFCGECGKDLGARESEPARESERATTVVSATGTPAGWYPAPDGGGGERYWDGQRWSEQRRGKVAAKTDPSRRYASLRLVATLFSILAVLVIVFGVIGIVATMTQHSLPGSVKVGAFFGGLFWSAFLSLALFAYAAFIRLMISIEANTRQAAEALSRSSDGTP
jgi:hypothetical protein